MFEPRTPLEQCIHTGDVAATLALLRSLTPERRATHRAEVMRLLKLMQAARYGSGPSGWGEAKPTDGQWRSLNTAIVLCGTARDVVATIVEDDLLVALGQEFRPRSLEGLAEAMLQHSPLWIHPVQRLIVAGLAPRPECDDYTLGLISLPRISRSPAHLAAMFQADPGLRPALLRVFSVEGTADVSLASSDKYNHAPEMAWGQLLLGLVDDGLTTRAELLERTLLVLEKDWPQYRAGWFSRFHAELAPDAAAMQPHLARYLGLCASRIAPTVALALDALRTLDAAQPIEGTRLLSAVRPVMASPVKGQLEAAMKLLDGVVKREPALAVQASAAVAVGLLHEAAAVQASVLKRIAAWGTDAQTRALLADLASRVAAAHRPRLAQLIGAAEVAVIAPPPAVQQAVHPVHALSDERRLTPLTDVHELVECIAHVFEHGHDADAFERAVSGLVEMAPLTEADQALFAPVKKRAARMKKLLPRELARLLLFALDGTRTAGHAGTDHGGNASLLEALLNERMDDLMGLAAQGKRLAPLSAPTHRGGFIEPSAFLARVAAHDAAGLVSPEAEQIRGLLRLCPGSTPALLQQARCLPEGAFTRALRYALGDELAPGAERELYAAAARIRHPRVDDAALDAMHPGLGPDAARVASYVWRLESRSHEYDGRTYTHHDFFVDVTPAVTTGAGRQRLAVLRHPVGGQVRRHYRWWCFAGIDEGAIACTATLLPSDPEAFFAEGARAVGNNLDWSEAQWQNRAYLELLLDPVTKMTPMACLLLALGLCGKEPGQAALAVDALVHAQAQGRHDVACLAGTLRSLLATPLVKVARLHKSLLAAMRADVCTHGLVFELLCEVLQARFEEPPRDTALLLDVLLELKISGPRPLPEAARDALASMVLSGRGRAVQGKLLEG